MQKALLALFILFPFIANADAEDKSGGWIGVVGGKQNAKAGSTITPTTLGATAGIKMESGGAGILFFTGSSNTTVRSVSVTQSSTVFTAHVDWFPGGSKIFYIGPSLSYATLKVAATLGSVAATASASGMMIGAITGVNLPLGFLSIGADGGYSVSGDVTILYYLGSVKIWF